MGHQNDLWNATQSDMMIETIAKCYGNGCAGMKALTFKENALICWQKQPPGVFYSKSRC